MLGRPSCVVCRRSFTPVRAPDNGEIGMALSATLRVQFTCPRCAAHFHGSCASSLGSARATPAALKTTCPRCGNRFEQMPGYMSAVTKV
jgi:hypothetical protein